MARGRRAENLRHRFFELLEQGPVGGPRTRAVNGFLIALIVANLIAAALESMPEMNARYGAVFTAIEGVSLAVFSLEYLLRLWVAAEAARHHHRGTALQARLAFMMSPAGIVDLLAILPFWIGFFTPLDLRFLLVFRVVRFLKLARYSPAMRSLIDVLYMERRALFGCVVILIGTSLVAASLMHLVEARVQPDKFGTIPDAMWWAIVTLGTIGYGDVVPVTAAGKVIAAVTIFCGLVMVALPVGIIASAFSQQIHRRDFVVTWGMVAKVPLFAELDASEIAEVMELLRAETVEPGDIVVQRGDAAHSMYFIAAGEVEIELKERTVRLGVGHFFGEIAVLRRARRSATVTARTRVNLLVLDAQDLHALMRREPELATRMRDMIRNKLGHELVTRHGDIVTEEVEDEDAETAKKS